MLRTRILTALVLLPLAWMMIFKASEDVFMGIGALLLMVGTWEFRKLAGLADSFWGWVLLATQAFLFWYLGTHWEAWTANPIAVFQLATGAWVILFAQMVFYRPGETPDRLYRIRGFINALVAITFAWMALAWLRTEPLGYWWVSLLLLAIWSSDVGAYFSGRAFGKRKMAPGISPGKTWAGLVGGVALAAVLPAGLSLLMPGLDAPLLPLALICAITALASVGGDLFISMHKRTVGCKDTGRILPGHGGILDRLDSLLAGAPVFALGKLLVGL